ncbi:MAG: hypothetical protein ABI587_18310 [Gemmatimonadales bacterium]
MSRVLVRLAFVALALAPLRAAQAQDLFPDVEYVAGKDNFPEKQKGTLMIGADELRFVDKNGELIFAIPLTSVTEVTQDVQIRDASVGKKLLFGGLAGSRKQEFIQITSETENSAEGVVFKVKQGTSVNIMAKVRFAVKKAGGRAAQVPAADSAH